MHVYGYILCSYSLYLLVLVVMSVMMFGHLYAVVRFISVFIVSRDRCSGVLFL